VGRAALRERFLFFLPAVGSSLRYMQRSDDRNALEEAKVLYR
jgi:hypothetical protein